MNFKVIRIHSPKLVKHDTLSEPSPKPKKKKPDPLAVARFHLGERLVEKDTGYWLDNLPASLDTIMQACNRVRKAMGLEQVTPTSRWRV